MLFQGFISVIDAFKVGKVLRGSSSYFQTMVRNASVVAVYIKSTRNSAKKRDTELPATSMCFYDMGSTAAI